MIYFRHLELICRKKCEEGRFRINPVSQVSHQQRAFPDNTGRRRNSEVTSMAQHDTTHDIISDTINTDHRMAKRMLDNIDETCPIRH